MMEVDGGFFVHTQEADVAKTSCNSRAIRQQPLGEAALG